MDKKRIAAAAALITLAGAFMPGSLAVSSSGTRPVTPGQKNETVYVDTDAAGKVNDIIVSVHLKTPADAKRLKDVSNLDSVTSITPGANPAIDGETITWQTGGEDVYYQGTSLSALPVECTFSYTLGGKGISPDDLAGKSGKVSISASFTNFDRHMERINGSLEELFTPFTMLTMIELPADHFSDIGVDNGKIIDRGDTVMVVGFGLPGLSGSLNIEDATLGISDSFTVTATVKDFELDAVTTIALPGILTAGDIGDMDLDSLQSDLNELDNGGKELGDAAAAFSSGMADFDRSLTSYIDGIDGVEAGLSELTGGIPEISDASDDLHAGAQELADALDAAAGNTDGLGEVHGQIASLADLSASLSGLSGLLASLEPLSNTLAGLTPEQLADLGIDPAMVAALQTAVAADGDLASSASALRMLSAQLQTSFEELSPLMESLPVLGENTQSIADGLSQLSDGLAELEQGAAQLSGALDTLSSNGGALRAGSQSLTDNAAGLASGMDRYSQGVHDFSQGANGSIDDVNARKDAVLALGEAYDNYSLLPQGCTGSVRFVFTTNPIRSFE